MPDERVVAALATWADRFCANGIGASDLAEVTASIESWDRWCAVWCGLGERHESLARRALAERRRAAAGWSSPRRRPPITLPNSSSSPTVQMGAAHRRAVTCLDEALPLLDPPGRRVAVPFPGHDLVGILRLPAESGRHPVTVLIPGLDSTKEELRLLEESFLSKGVGTFAVDGPG